VRVRRCGSRRRVENHVLLLELARGLEVGSIL
jgi:hypothetical protein